jgi:DNA mismatch repair protein MutL
MADKIRVLSDQTINQIAAGEVIESPASVVKELVENAIDAGATRLKIEILGGGFQWIKVSDDGLGMSGGDALLCLQRHATSKIARAEDLLALNTMGFRGEALASIAAISKMRLLTALENAPAIDVEIEGGKIMRSGPGARSRGTTIEVRSLFYNVPARKKFQKSPASSSAEITKMLTQLCFAHPEVGFELIQQNRLHFSLPPSSGEEMSILLKHRAQALLGTEYLPSCRDFVLKQTDYGGCGWIADPLFSRQNRSGQHLFINRRPVLCPAVAYAIRDAYGTRLGTGRHPIYLLHLTIAPHLVDVNVHPQKREVRLREESLLKASLQSAVHSAFGHVTTSTFKAEELSPFFTPPSSCGFFEELVLKEDVQAPETEALPLEHPLQYIGLHGRYVLVDALSMPSSLFQERDRSSLGVVWVDLPAAEARIHLDALMKKTADGVPLSQGLLFPISLSFSKAEAALLKAHIEMIQALGLQVRESGECAFIVEGIPPFMKEEEIPSIFVEIIGALQGLEVETPSYGEARMRHLAATLCRKVRFCRRFYSLEEAKRIVARLVKTDDPLHCPQGKKTLFHIREEEIEHRFTAKSSF